MSPSEAVPGLATKAIDLAFASVRVNLNWHVLPPAIPKYGTLGVEEDHLASLPVEAFDKISTEETK